MAIDYDVPEANIVESRRLSIVWLLPLVAALAGGWLLYDTLDERGPLITIAFLRGDGIEANKTVLRYKAVQVGRVTTVRIADDLRHVVATARIERSFAAQLKEGTRFWVVRPRVGASGVSGLGTLVSGAYIEIDPGSGDPESKFVGLETPPIVAADVPGNSYVLESEILGSIQAGSPISFRDIPVGEVLGYELAEDGSRVTIHIFVREPYTLLVRSSTQFSNASGINVSVNANGLDLRTGSLQTLLVGGITFDLVLGNKAAPSPPGTKYWLYDSPERIGEARPSAFEPYLLYFEDSVRGLTIGAPVEFKGIKLGSVTNVDLEVDPNSSDIRIPVTIQLQPQRLIPASSAPAQQSNAIIESLITKGFRARLQTGSLLTGQMFVELGFYPDTSAAHVINPEGLTVIPTIPSEFVEIKHSASEVLDKLRKLPVEEIGKQTLAAISSFEKLLSSPQINKILVSANDSFQSIEVLTDELSSQLVPLASQLTETLASVDENSALQSQLSLTLQQVDNAARALRTLADSIERNPNSVIWGKKNSKPASVERH
ncbi:MAG: paraquat-inducible protein B [Gammaproteobacteria bacterium]|jgi:paraquat-inducible protein B